MATILLIEPHVDRAHRYAESLEKAGLLVELVSSAATRHDIQPDLVVISVPRLDRAQFGAVSKNTGLPKIALSSEPADADRATEFECAAVLIQPVMYDDLVTEVRRVLKTTEQPA
jgi:AmiR/NasT family two-component response regulator